MYRIGVDLGGTNIAVGVVDNSCAIVGRASLKTNLPRPAEEIVKSIAEAVRLALKDAGVAPAEIEEVGIGSPGLIDPENGTVIYANNLKFQNVPLAALLEKEISKACRVINDANAAAYGEYLAGAGKGVKNLVLVTLGTGIGGGVIYNGKIYSGSHLAGTEPGHMVIVTNGYSCSCGRMGCWEVYASVTALIRQTKQMMYADLDSKMWEICGRDLDAVNGRTAFDAMRQGDPAGTQVFKRYVKYIGIGIANLINLYDPDVICIGGGISREGETLLEPVRKLVVRELYGYGIREDTVKICAAELGNDAGIIGAAFVSKLYSET